MRITGCFLLILFFYSCNTPRVMVDYDQQVNFEKYESLRLYEDMATGLNQLDEARLLAAIENVVAGEELRLSEDAGLLLNVYSEAFRERSDSRLGIGIGGGGGNVGVGVSGGIPVGGMTTVLRLTFDLVDATNESLVWQAVVEAPFDLDASPEQRRKRLHEMVEKAFKAYPPKR